MPVHDISAARVTQHHMGKIRYTTSVSPPYGRTRFGQIHVITQPTKQGLGIFPHTQFWRHLPAHEQGMVKFLYAAIE